MHKPDTYRAFCAFPVYPKSKCDCVRDGYKESALFLSKKEG